MKKSSKVQFSGTINIHFMYLSVVIKNIVRHWFEYDNVFTINAIGHIKFNLIVQELDIFII